MCQRNMAGIRYLWEMDQHKMADIRCLMTPKINMIYYVTIRKPLLASIEICPWGQRPELSLHLCHPTWMFVCRLECLPLAWLCASYPCLVVFWVCAYMSACGYMANTLCSQWIYFLWILRISSTMTILTLGYNLSVKL